MGLRVILGYFLVAIPFVAIFLVAWKSCGAGVAISAFSAAGIVVLLIFAGVRLIQGG